MVCCLAAFARIIRKETTPLRLIPPDAWTAPTRSGVATIRLTRALRVAVAVLPLLLLLAAQPAAADTVATVIPPDGLNLRAAPGTDQASLGVIPGGTRIALTGPVNEAGWYPAVYGGRRGWVRGEFLSVPGDGALAARPAAVRSPDGLLLRAGPHTTSEPLALMPNGASVTVGMPATTDGWLLTAFNGLTGWASADFLQVESQPAFTPPPAAPVAAPPVASTGSGSRATITFYHPRYEGSPMACGGRYRAEDATIVAATSWPCGTRLRVCRGTACVVVTVQDTGHMGPNWVDLSAAAFRQLAPMSDTMVTGTVDVLPRE
jgi:uncharacterized protein YraI